jgi:hypothetical protein
LNFLKVSSHYVVQIGLEILDSSNPTLTSQYLE